MYACMYLCLCMCLFVFMYVCMYVCVCVYVCLCVYSCVFMYVFYVQSCGSVYVVVLGVSGFVSCVFKNNGFVHRMGIGVNGVSSKEFNLNMDCGKEWVRGDVVMWINGVVGLWVCALLLLF